MNRRWEQIRGLMGDVWSFFVLPVLNLCIIVVIFSDVALFLSHFIVDAINEARQIPHYNDSVGSLIEKLSLQKLITVAQNQDLLVSLLEFISQQFVTALAAVSVSIFMVHKFTLALGRFVFGVLEVNRARLIENPRIQIAVEQVADFMPRGPRYASLKGKWEYAKTVNDDRSTMSIYHDERMSFRNDKEKLEEYAAHAIAYFTLSLASIGLSIYKLSVPSFFSIFTVVITLVALLWISVRLVNRYVEIVELDLYTFLSLSDGDVSRTRFREGPPASQSGGDKLESDHQIPKYDHLECPSGSFPLLGGRAMLHDGNLFNLISIGRRLWSEVLLKKR